MTKKSSDGQEATRIFGNTVEYAKTMGVLKHEFNPCGLHMSWGDCAFNVVKYATDMSWHIIIHCDGTHSKSTHKFNEYTVRLDKMEQTICKLKDAFTRSKMNIVEE